MSGFFLFLIILLFFVIPILYFVILRALSPSTKESFFVFIRKVFLFFVLILPLFFGFFLYLIFSEGKLEKVIYFLTSRLYFLVISAVFSLFLFLTYLLLVIYKREIAYNIFNYFRFKISFKKEGIWQKLDKVRRRRILIIFLLALFLLTFFLLNVFLIYKISLKEDFLLKKEKYFGVFLVVYLVSLIYFLTEIIWGQRARISFVSHKKEKEINSIIENLSITRGIPKPEIKIVQSDIPNIFSLYPNFGKPIIYITVGLLNLLNRNELESALASQITEISSGLIFDYKWINNLIVSLKALSFPIFILGLTLINENIVFWVIGIIIFLYLFYFIEFFSRDVGPLISPEEIIELLNPVFLFVDFFSYIIYYFLSFNDFFYTDLKSIELTRYPEGYYSMLHKVQKFRSFFGNLPSQFYYLYLFGENVFLEKQNLPQPPISLRKKLISRVFPNIKRYIFQGKENLICPFCSYQMKEIEVPGHYGTTLKIDQCSFCGSVWFDELELFCLSESVGRLAGLLFNKEYKEKLRKVILPKDILCPRCGVELEKLKDPMIPGYILIWNCPSCDGNLLDLKNLYEYYKYRETIKEAKIKRRSFF